MDEPTCTIDGAGPYPVVRPTTAAELGDLVRRAAADGNALFPLGGRTLLGIGRPPSRPGLGVDLRGLDAVVDYPARDMTITVGAGITLARLAALLRPENQRLPVDVPRPDASTLGGAIAANVSGPRRLGFGTLRDYVIGISVVTDEGHETKAGGRVVKNVAGYDLCKLHVGALGTLGIVTQVTLKLRPLPEGSALLAFACPPDRLGPLLDGLHATRTRPVCLDVLNARAARGLPSSIERPDVPDGGWLVVAGFEDSADTVRWQVRQLVKELTAAGLQGVDALAASAGEPFWHALAEFRLRPDAALTFKANLLPHAVADFCRRADALDAPLLQAHAGSGIVVGHLLELPLDRARAVLDELTTAALAAEGNLVLLQAPPAWKADLPVWGRRRGDADLMRAVKDRLDPRGLFNPGRFVP